MDGLRHTDSLLVARQVRAAAGEQDAKIILDQCNEAWITHAYQDLANSAQTLCNSIKYIAKPEWIRQKVVEFTAEHARRAVHYHDVAMRFGRPDDS